MPPRLPPKPLTGGPIALLRFMREHNMIRWGYVPLIARWAWLKLRWRGRLVTDGLCFIRPGVKFEIGRAADRLEDLRGGRRGGGVGDHRLHRRRIVRETRRAGL